MNFFEACKRSYDFNMRYKGRKFSTLKKMYNFSNDIGNFIKYLFFILRVHFISVDIQIQTQAAFVNKVNFILFTFPFLNFFLSGYVLFVGQSVRVIFVINIFLNISTFFHYHQINRKSCEYRHKKIGHNQINVDKQNNKIFEYTWELFLSSLFESKMEVFAVVPLQQQQKSPDVYKQHRM